MQLRADFKLIAKALGRIGSAYSKKGDLETAIKYFQKSLTEHRTADILNKLREAERAQAEQARLAYLSPEKANEAREEGNALFKTGDFAGAVKAYTEAIKRDPQDPRGYNNRANAYTKLAALPEALKDAEEAIKVDPKFVKAYIRKGHVLFAMRDYTKAMETMQVATDIDGEKKHTKEINDLVFKCQQALYSERQGENEEETLQRAMRDPEVAVSTGISPAARAGTDMYSYVEDYERSHHAVNSPASAARPCRSAGSYEESGCADEHHEACERWYHQDEIGRDNTLSLAENTNGSLSNCFVSLPLYYATPLFYPISLAVSTRAMSMTILGRLTSDQPTAPPPPCVSAKRPLSLS